MKQQINEIRRMQQLAGILKEGQLNEIEGLPEWVESVEFDPHWPELAAHVTDNWYNQNKEKIKTNIEDIRMLTSSARGYLPALPNYDPKKDYISDGGVTYIDNEGIRTNQSDSLKSRQDAVNRIKKNQVEDELLIDLLDPEDRRFVRDIVTDDEIKQLENYTIENYKKQPKLLYIIHK